jgi:hypothetical protein
VVSSLALPNANITFSRQNVSFSRDLRDSADKGDEIDTRGCVGANKLADVVDPADAYEDGGDRDSTDTEARTDSLACRNPIASAGLMTLAHLLTLATPVAPAELDSTAASSNALASKMTCLISLLVLSGASRGLPLG